MKNVTVSDKQVRKIIQEEMTKIEGYDQLTLQEKKDLEEGVMDWWNKAKAGVAGGLAGAGAKLQNVGSGIAGAARGALSGAKAGATGQSQATVKGATVRDAALIAGLKKASSLVNSYVGQLRKASENAVKAISGTSFGKADDVKPQLLQILQTGDQAKLDDLAAKLTKAQTGDQTAIGALAIKSKGEGDIGKQLGGSKITIGGTTSTRQVNRPENPEEETPEVPAGAAEAITEAVIRRLVAMEKSKKSR